MNVRRLLLALALFTAAFPAAHSQEPDKPETLAPAVPPVATPAENTDRAWGMLTSTVKDTKHVDNCIQALAALGTMGTNERAAGLIADSFKDPERDVRIAAILAAAQTKNPRLLRYIRVALDDAEPEVAFAAATALWKLHDYSGEDILVAVATGERRANATLMNGARHTAARDLHNPATIAKLGATQGAYFLLGPFGIGLSAVEYARKNGGDSARASSIDLLAEQHTAGVRKELVDGLEDKDPGVRAAAAKALGQWSDPATASALAVLLDDTKLPVRLTGAAAYLRSSTGRRTGNANAKKASPPA